MSELVVAVDQSRATGCLGASEVPAALGLVKYKSPMALWRQLRGETEESVPEAVRQAAEYGQLFEPVIRGQYALQERVRVLVPDQSVIHPDGWMRATPDGYVLDTLVDEPGHTEEWTQPHTPGGMLGLLQVKCRSAWQADAWEDGPPPAEEVQCRVEMHVTGAPWNDLVCLLGGNRRVKYRIERDLKIEETIVRDAKAFWQLVLDGVPPSVDDSEAWSQRAASLMKPGKVVLHADDELRALLVELRQARAQRKQAEAMEQAQRTQILLRLGAAGATVVDGGDLGKCTAYPNPARMSWQDYAKDLEGKVMRAAISDPSRGALMAMAPDGWDKERERFKKPGSGWAIRTPRNWGEGDDE